MPEKKFSKLFELESSSVEEESEFLGSNSLEKQKSPIPGVGIFTKIKISQNKVFYNVPLNDVRSIPAPHCAKITRGKFVFDPKILNWVNHSCEANSEIVLQEQSVVLRAKRIIQAGEEITLDYCETEEKNNLVSCACNSTKCRNYFYTT